MKAMLVTSVGVSIVFGLFIFMPKGCQARFRSGVYTASSSLDGMTNSRGDGPADQDLSGFPLKVD